MNTDRDMTIKTAVVSKIAHSEIANGLTSARAEIIKVLVAADPRISPITSDDSFFLMAAKATEISGRLVPTESIRIPTLTGGTRNRLERLREAKNIAREERINPSRPAPDRTAVCMFLWFKEDSVSGGDFSGPRRKMYSKYTIYRKARKKPSNRVNCKSSSSTRGARIRALI